MKKLLFALMVVFGMSLASCGHSTVNSESTDSIDSIDSIVVDSFAVIDTVPVDSIL